MEQTPSTPTTSSSSSRKPRVRRGSKPYIFHIESKTRPGRFHVADAHRLTCSCEAGQRTLGCWHLRLALGLYDWWRHEQRTAQAERFVARQTGPAAPAPVPMAPVPMAPVPMAPVPMAAPAAPTGERPAGHDRWPNVFE